MDRFHFVSFALALAALFSACAATGQHQNAPSTVTAQVDQAPVLFRPAAGEVTSNFDGKTNKGLDFAGNLGDPVVAVAAGHVVFAAATMRGYGQMIIIKHNSTYLTAYAHNNDLLVKEGDMVYAGQIVARMGSTDTDRVKLHFEVWRNGVSIDPMQYLNRIAVAVPVVATIPPKPAVVAPTSHLDPSDNVRPSESTTASVKPVPNRTTNAPGPVVDIANTTPRSTFNNSAPPLPEFKDIEARMAYLRWLGEVSERLKNEIPDWPTRKELLQTVWYEAKRAGFDVNLVLGLIKVDSNFRKFAVSSTGARGFMQVMPSRVHAFGDEDVAKLFHTQINLRYGCSLLRHYLNAQNGDLWSALVQYESEHMGFDPRDSRVLSRVSKILTAELGFVVDGKSPNITLEKRPLPPPEKASPASPAPSKPAVVTIPVAPDGHYYLKGTVNGLPIVFVVDTGATNVAISDEWAIRANVRGGKVGLAETANGVTKTRVVGGVNVFAGPLSVPGGVPVTVIPGLGDTALLGQRFLQRFAITIGGGKMVIQDVPQ